MKQSKRIMAVLLAMFLIVQMPITALAAEKNTPKEEVVYINMNQDGSVKEIYVVNIFDLDESGQIIDYGEYENLRNMTTTDEIGYSDSKVTINATAGKLYYEGKLSANVMPWDISIHYYIDGVEYSAKDIAGKSGALRITMSVRKNTECNSAFFEGYALQTTFVLDTEKCKDIVTEGATIANVGSDKQLTYTILPNKETDIEITANVEDFEMDGIAINGVQFNLDIEVDDAELQGKIDDIVNAVNDLDKGATSLYEGTGDLYVGTSDLYEGTGELSDGASTLSDGVGTLDSAMGTLNEKVGELHTGVGSLSSGADTLYNGLSTLIEKNTELTNAAWSAYSALCSVVEAQLNEELVANGLDEVTLTPDNYSTVLMDILSKLDADAVYEQAYNTALQEVTAQVEAQAEELYSGYIQSQADAIYSQYIQSQADTLYTQVAMEMIYKQLIATGYTDEQAQTYLQTQEGQTKIAQTVDKMTDEQKTQILNNAVAQLTEKQKQQILQGALDSLTKDQKAQIRNTYIEKMMESEEVTQKIAATVAKVNATAAKVTELKGQFYSYGAFYQGLLDYTSGVSEVANGANTLKGGLDTLYTNTDTLRTSVGELKIATGQLSEGVAELDNGATELNNGTKELLDGSKKLNDGTKELSEGTGEFVEETSGMDTQVSDEIDSLISSMSGNDLETVSFVSEQNTNIKSVQFVIKTDAIQVEEVETVEVEKEESLNFWQKLLDLFGLK